TVRPKIILVRPKIILTPGKFERYFYNFKKGRCEIFIYGGCFGNQNNFETEKECLRRCRPH
uniref:BPTI/Kunitz inhibitor domain-containing protein n=1 Tax=Oryzias sinensis TaxID=183150 RepID=A0A8C7WUF1_9TELE